MAQLPGQFMSLLDVARFLVNPSPPQPDPIALFGGFVGPEPIHQFKDGNGKPLAYGQLWSFLSGTDTPIALAANGAGTVSQTNPIILDAYGRTNYFLSPGVAYKLRLFDAAGVEILTRDPVIVPWIDPGPVVNDAPPGTMVWYTSTIAPYGWIFCTGAWVQQAAYPALYAAIGIAYNKSTHPPGPDLFQLPGMIGYFMLGQAALGTGSVLGSGGGSINHTHLVPSHTHTMTHTHSLPRSGWGSVLANPGQADRLLVGPGANVYQPNGDSVTASQSAASTGATTLSTAGNNPPFMALTAIIRAI